VNEQGALRSAPAAERNYAPILGVLRREFSRATRVLEIGAGTGQHAAGFAADMPWLRWVPSDQPGDIATIESWRLAVGSPNLERPVVLDVSTDRPPEGPFDAAFSANTAHIMHENNVRDMFRVVGTVLEPGGRFCLYGPFRENDEFSTESNARFDASLRQTDPGMGIRDIEMIDRVASGAGLQRVRRFAMPGNNLMLLFERQTNSGLGA
jgi:cyclopropane fatty-acyl-phospholipid synthase-like methyltransferase